MKEIDNYPAITNSFHSLKREDHLIVLLSALRLPDAAREEAVKLARSDVDWEFLLESAIRHDIVPLLYSNIQKLDGVTVPHTVFDDIRDISAQTVSSNSRLIPEAAAIAQEAKKRETYILFAKGPVLIADVYKEAGKRFFSDIDVFVSRDGACHFEKILRGRGYCQVEGDDAGYRSQKVFRNSAGVTVDMQAGPVGRDLHNSFIGFDFDNIYDRRRHVLLEGRDVPTLGIEDTLIYYTLHLSMHHSFQGLRWFVDIHEFISSYAEKIDWEEVMDIASVQKVKRPLFYALLFTKELYGTRVPDDVMDTLSRMHRRMDRQILDRIRKRNNVVDYLAELFMFDSLNDTFKFVFKSFIRYPYMLKHFAGIFYKALKGR